VPLEEPLETDVREDVSVEPEPVVDVLPVGLVVLPDDSGVDVEDVVEVELLTVAPIENPPLVP